MLQMDEVTKEFDELAAELSPTSATVIMDELVAYLGKLKNTVSDEHWQRIVELCATHDLRELVHQDPFTRHAYEKPRGYPGDAELLDYIYGPDERWTLPSGTSTLGKAIFKYTKNAPAAAGVRTRAQRMATRIDDLAKEREHPDIFCMACGHLRESHMAGSLRQKRLGRWLAMDADAESLRTVRAECGHHGVETIHGNVKDLIMGRHDIGRFDLSYSTGLYDYLEDKVAAKLLQVMFATLRPRGLVVIANFMKGIGDVGYMEAFMKWPLIFRDQSDMLDLAMQLPQELVGDIRIVVDDLNNIVFLEVERRAGT